MKKEAKQVLLLRRSLHSLKAIKYQWRDGPVYGDVLGNKDFNYLRLSLPWSIALERYRRPTKVITLKILNVSLDTTVMLSSFQNLHNIVILSPSLYGECWKPLKRVCVEWLQSAFQVNSTLATQSRLRVMGIALLHLVRAEERHISSTNSPASHCQESLQAKEGKEREAQKKPCTCLRPTLRQYLVQAILICPLWIRMDGTYRVIFLLLGFTLCLENKGTRCLQRDPASSTTEQCKLAIPLKSAGKKHQRDCK